MWPGYWSREFVVEQPNARLQPQRLIFTPAAGGCKPMLGRLSLVRYTRCMTRALDVAVAKLETLPPEDQDRMARWLLDELRDEENWAQRFGASQAALSTLAAEARADRKGGNATELNPDTL